MKNIHQVYIDYHFDQSFVDIDDILGYSHDKDNNVTSLEFYEPEYDDFPIRADQLIAFISEFKKLKHLHIEIDDYSIKNLEPLSDLHDLETIYLEETTVEINDLRFARNMSQLKNLTFPASNIQEISSLSNNKKLQKLVLTNANIKDISALNGLQELSIINLSDNKIKDISALNKAIKLEHIYLNNNQLTNIDVLKNLSELTNIGLADNNIKDFTALSNKTKLVNLYIANNQITNLDFLINSTSLHSLNISNNSISNLDVLAENKKLSSLYISNNSIKNIDFLANNKALKQLNISDNLIENIDCLAKHQDLTSLNISNNPIRSIDSIQTLMVLTNLVATDLSRVSIAPSFRFRSNLIRLNLSNCNLEDISFLSTHKNIYELNLSNNQISNFEHFKDFDFPKLKHLNLNNNNIASVFPIYYFSNIDAIDLRDNLFGNQLFEKYKGVSFYQYSTFYKFDHKEDTRKGTIHDLKKLAADYYYENGESDAALAYYYYDNSSESKTHFQIYVNRLLNIPINEATYIKYYFHKIAKNSQYLSEELCDQLLDKFKKIKNSSDQRALTTHLTKIKNLDPSSTYFRFDMMEFNLYEKETKRPLITNELLFLKAVGMSARSVERARLNICLYYLKLLHERKSPFFYNLKNKILETLKNKFAYTVEERELHDFYEKIVLNIDKEPIKKLKNLKNQVEIAEEETTKKTTKAKKRIADLKNSTEQDPYESILIIAIVSFLIVAFAILISTFIMFFIIF